MVRRSTCVVRLFAFAQLSWNGQVGRLPSYVQCIDSRKDWLSLVSRIPQTSKSLYAVHALKGSSFFYFTKRGDLDCCGTGCLQVVQLLSCFCRRGCWLPLAVSGRETCSKLEGRLPSVDPGQGTFADTGAGCPAVVSGSRSFCRHGGWLLCSGLGHQELLWTRGLVASGLGLRRRACVD